MRAYLDGGPFGGACRAILDAREFDMPPAAVDVATCPCCQQVVIASPEWEGWRELAEWGAEPVGYRLCEYGPHAGVYEWVGVAGHAPALQATAA